MSRFLAVLMLCAAGLHASPQEPAFRQVSYEEALRLALETDRLAVVVFVEEGCEDCERLRTTTWANGAVERWLEVEAIAVEVDGAQRADLVERLAIQKYPTILFLEKDEIEYGRVVGFIKTKRFLTTFKGIHDGRLMLRQALNRLAENPDDPVLRLDLARALVSSGRRQSAVEEYERIWKDYRGASEHRRIRLVKVLTELEAMKGSHPPARQAMVRWRVVALRGVRGEAEGDAVEAARELSALNKHLTDPEAMLEIWTEMRDRGDTPPEVLAQLFDGQVISQLHHQRRFKELLEGLRDPLARVQKLMDELDEFRRREREGELADDELLAVTVFENSLFSTSGLYFELLLKVGRDEEALELQEYVVAREPLGRAYASMMFSARNARRRELARQIGEAGLEILEKQERRYLRDAYERVFGGSR